MNLIQKSKMKYFVEIKISFFYVFARSFPGTKANDYTECCDDR